MSAGRRGIRSDCATACWRDSARVIHLQALLPACVLAAAGTCKITIGRAQRSLLNPNISRLDGCGWVALSACGLGLSRSRGLGSLPWHCATPTCKAVWSLPHRRLPPIFSSMGMAPSPCQASAKLRLLSAPPLASV
jgi:hypothetical protein